MRHSDIRGLEKNAQVLDDEYEGLFARSIDDHYHVPFSPNSSNEYMNDRSTQQEHSLFTFVAEKAKKSKKKNSSSTNTTNNLVEEESSVIDDKPTKIRGRLVSREYTDIQFDMEPESARQILANDCTYG
jgi:hypothetical protein